MDILFLINFMMDIIIFIITTMMLNKPFNLKRIMIASIIAALLYCMLLIYPVLQRLPYSVYAMLIPVIPILYLYRPMCLKKFFKYYLISTCVAALIGGISFTLWYQLQYYILGYKPTLEFILLIGIGVGIMVYSLFYAIRRRLIMPHFEYDLEIYYDGKVQIISALLDTGNMLYTPIGHQPVLVVTYEAVKDLLAEEESQAIQSCHNDMEKMMELDKFPKYIIPFHSMGCENGLLWGVMSECIVLHKGGFEKQIPKCVMGIAFGSLCSNRAYKALIHPDFILSEGE